MLRRRAWDAPIDRSTGAVWAAMIATGFAAWMTSGTPVVGGLIVVSVLLAIASPAGALYGTCAAIPLVFHPVQLGAMQLGLLEIGILVTVTGLGLRVVYDAMTERRFAWNLRPRTLIVWVLPAILLSIGTLSLFWMPFDSHRAEALRTWRWVIAEPIMFFGMARWTIRRQGPATLAIAVAAPATVVAGLAFWQMLGSTSAFKVDNVQRSTATYLHPNNLALYLERAVFLVLIPGLLLGGRARRWLLGMAAIIGLGIATTFSRGALIGLGAGGAIFLLAHPVRFGWRTFTWAGVTGGGLFLLLAGQRFTGAHSSGMLTTRGQLWRDSAVMVRDFPVTGIGLDQFLWLHRQRYIDPRIWNERYTSHPHNLGLDAWLSLGLPGLFLLGGVFVAGIWLVLAIRKERFSADPWQLGALACLGAGLGHGLVDNGYFLPDLAVMSWLAIALLVTSAAPANLGPSDVKC